MKCQSLFSDKKMRKNISKCHVLKILLSMLRVKVPGCLEQVLYTIPKMSSAHR